MKKRWFTAALLALVLVVSGCAGKAAKVETSSKSAESVTEASKVTVSETQTEKVTAESETKETETGSETQTEAPQNPETPEELQGIPLRVRDYSDWLYDEEQQMMTLRRSYQETELSEEEAAAYPALAKAFAELNEEMKRRAEDFASGNEEMIRDLLSAEETREYLPLNYESKLCVKRADSSVVSIVECRSEYSGGVHGSVGFYGWNYDVKNGRKLEVSDLFPDTGKLGQILIEKVLGIYPEELLFPDMDDEMEQYLEEYASFAVEPDGVTFYFNPYDIGPYSSGLFEVKIYYDEAENLFADGVRGGMDSYVLEVAKGEQFRFRNAAGQEKSLELFGGFEPDFDQEQLTLMLDDVAVKTETYGYSSECFLMHPEDGSNYLVCHITSDNDYGMLFVFDVNGERPVQTDSVGGAHFARTLEEEGQESYTRREIPGDPKQFSLLRRCDLLSTYEYLQPVSLAGGKIQPAEDICRVIRYQEEPLVLKRTLRLVSVEKDSFREGSLRECPEGTKLFFAYTDGVDNVYFTLEDGSMVKVHLSSVEWPMQVDGQDIEDLFEGLFFAG